MDAHAGVQHPPTSRSRGRGRGSPLGIGLALVVFAAAMLTGCSDGGGSAASSDGTSTASGATVATTGATPSGLPGGAARNPSITLAMVQPDAGVAPVVAFIEAARTSIDLGTYEFDPDFEPVVGALQRAQQRGVKVRVLVSRTEFPPSGKQENPADVAALRAKGIKAALSDPKFSYYHAKVIIADAGTAAAKVLLCDFNFAAGYFGHDPKYPKEGATRGMALNVTDPADVKEISEYFDADWPPIRQWPASVRPDILWSPSADTFTNPGNSQAGMLSFINGATATLDIYEQQFPLDSVLFAPLLAKARAGVKVRMVGNKVGMDQRVADQLTAAGVRIIYGPSDPAGDGSPMYIHTKTMVADAGTDREVAYVGSINPFLDQSLQTERELGAWVTDPVSVDRIVAVFDRDFASPTRPSSGSPGGGG